MLAFLFYFIRFCCLVGFIMNLTLVNIFNFWSLIFTLFGFFAAIDLYVIGLIRHENKKGMPAIFILLRFFQFVIYLLTDGILRQHLAINSGWDVFVFALMIYDGKYTFIEREDKNTQAKTTIRRD